MTNSAAPSHSLLVVLHPSVRVSVTTGAPILLDPGVYWLVAWNSHATSTFNLRRVSSPTLALPEFRTKAIAAIGSSLDYRYRLDERWRYSCHLAGRQSAGPHYCPDLRG